MSSSVNVSALPWWKRPSPVWLLAVIPISSLFSSATLDPRLEIYTTVVCYIHKPDIFRDAPSSWHGQQSAPLLSLSSTVDSAPFHFSAAQSNPWYKACAADPDVNAEAAKLAAVTSTTLGVLSCLTTGWWGAFSDRHGRKKVMVLSVVGLLFNDLNFINVYYFFERLPGGYWFILVGPILEGLVGGLTAASAAIHVYIADCTQPAERSRIFSLFMGLMFTGVALGPTIGSFMIRLTGKTISVFIAATVVHAIYALYATFIVPESLSEDKQQEARISYRNQEKQSGFKRVFQFLRPLAVFSPFTANEQAPSKGKRTDWNLTLVALGFGFTSSVLGSILYKFQYAAKTFGWTTEIMGYWLTLIGSVRAVYMAIILPLIIKLSHGRRQTPPPVSVEPREVDPLITDANPGMRPPSSVPVQVDLVLARASLFIEIVAYIAMGVTQNVWVFIGGGILASFGGGFGPAIQSIAIELYDQRGETESGRLFGALSVVTALSAQILGPSLYGLVYLKTVATVPSTIFFCTVASLIIAFLLLAFVRIPKRHHANLHVIAEEAEAARETALEVEIADF